MIQGLQTNKNVWL